MVFRDSQRCWDVSLLVSASILAIAGTAAMISATGTTTPTLAVRHILYLLLGWVSYYTASRRAYPYWMRWMGIAYGCSIFLLVLVLLFGSERLGASRWLSIFGISLQPSEIAKLATIGVLARYLVGQPRPLPPNVVGFSLGLVALPLLLIFLQPDLGSASIFGAFWLGMVWVAGISPRMLMTGVGVSAGLLPFGWWLLKDYQRQRLMIFLHPDADPLGAGYNIIQSTIAIGSGQWWGRGWAAGTQNRLRFVPERHSDFIFCIIGEEWGFLGCMIVIVAFGVLLFRALRIAQQSPVPLGRLLAVGIASWIAYQALVNLGMVMGLIPVVGVPLPLLSYGGSSMIVVWTALGFLESIHRTQRPHGGL